MTQQSRVTSLFGDLLEKPQPQDSTAVVIKQPVQNTVDVQLSSGEILRRLELVGSASFGDTVTLRYNNGTYVALAAGSNGSAAGIIAYGFGTGSGVVGAYAPSPHDLLGSHHTLPSLGANLFLATPSGSAGLPSFRAIAPADLPGGFSGFANPTAQVGLTAVNGVASTAMRSDAAPALSQSIIPTWTGAHTWTQPATFNSTVTIAGITTINNYTQITLNSEQLRLRYDANNVTVFTVNASGTLTITPSGLGGSGDLIINPQGRNFLPQNGYRVNIGSLQKKFLSLFVAELWVETLVAQDTIATIGGRVLICPTTLLTRDILSTDTTIYVKHNQMQAGDVAYMEANGALEFIGITSSPTTITQGSEYSYSVTRNLDGTGANNWSAGDALANTGSPGSGFIDLYSLESIRGLTFDYIFNYTAATTTFSANLFNENAFSIMGTTNTAGDMIYYGLDGTKFDGIYHYIQTGVVDSGTTRVVEYWNGSTWTNIVGLSVTGSLAVTGFVTFTWTIGSQTGWATTTINGINTYWVRYRLVSGTVTSPAKQGYRRVYRAKNTWGPTIAGMYRYGSSYDQFDVRWAIGNLSGWYDYSGNPWGAAFGDYAATWIGVDATNGYRVMNGVTALGQWSAAGVVTIGNTTQAHTRIASGVLDMKMGSTVVMRFDAPSNAAYFNAVVTIATTGEIRQGTGTVGSNYTGIRIYNSGGVGVIAGYNTNVAQWYGDTDGIFKAGAGAVTLDANGISIYAAGTGIPETNHERSYSFLDNGGTMFARILANRSSKQIGMATIGTNASAYIDAYDTGTTKQASILVDSFTPAIYLRANSINRLIVTTNGITVDGDLVAVNADLSGALAVGGSAYGSGSLGTNAIECGNTGVNYAPTNVNWFAQSTLLLNAADYSTIGFHDSGSRVDFIRVGAGIMVLGYDGGFGSPYTVIPQNLGIGGVHSDLTYYRLQVEGGIRSNGNFAGVYTIQRNDATTLHAMYADNDGDGKGNALRLWNTTAGSVAWFNTSGDVYNKGNSASWNTVSDERIKIVQGDYDKGLKELLKIRPVKYLPNPAKKALANDGKVRVGIVAQEIKKILPDAVIEMPDADSDGDKLLSFNQDELVWLLVNAVKDLSAELDILKAKV